MKQTGVFNVGLAAFVVLGVAAVAVCLGLWSFYESRHELDQRQIAEVDGKYKKAHSELTTAQSEAIAARLANAECLGIVKRQTEGLRNIVRERDEALRGWQAQRDAARKEGAAANRRIADLMNRIPPEGFVEQCKALEELRLRYRP